MLNVQALKDTFYTALQARIAAGNPARTIVVRGVLRPAVLVTENEFPAAAVDGIAPAETFCLRWTGLRIDETSSGRLMMLGCEIAYASDGSSEAAGLDRGRALAAMDAELAHSLGTIPMSAPGITLAEIPGGGASAATMTGSNVFWGDAEYAPVVTRGERLERTAKVEVFGYGQ